MESEKLAYSVLEFAKATGLSKTFLYEQIKTGQGPRLTRVGRRTLITVEDAQNWLRSRSEDSESSKEAA